MDASTMQALMAGAQQQADPRMMQAMQQGQQARLAPQATPDQIAQAMAMQRMGAQGPANIDPRLAAAAQQRAAMMMDASMQGQQGQQQAATAQGLMKRDLPAMTPEMQARLAAILAARQR